MSGSSTLALREEIYSVMSQDLNLEIQSAETDLIASGVMDSLALVGLIVQLEERYGVEIILDELDLEVFRTVTTIAMFITQLQHESGLPGAWQDVQAS